MGHNVKTKKRELPSSVLVGEVPKTIFKDHLNSIRVDLISGFDKNIDLTAYAFQQATWRNDPYIPGVDKSEDKRIKTNLKLNVLEGNGLPLSLELYDFVFCVSGINRVITHQIVRNRIGATYSQQCSGDKDWRHHNVLVPRSIFNNQEIHKAFVKNVLDCKHSYCNMLDSLEIPILDARKILPHCMETFIYVKFNLVTLTNFIKKRDCVQTQEPEMVILARRMRDSVVKKYPQFENLLENECKKGKCFYTKSDRMVGTSMFLPDEDHDFDYNKENFLYPQTVHDMVYDLPEVDEVKYLGYQIKKQ